MSARMHVQIYKHTYAHLYMDMEAWAKTYMPH